MQDSKNISDCRLELGISFPINQTFHSLHVCAKTYKAFYGIYHIKKKVNM